MELYSAINPDKPQEMKKIAEYVSEHKLSAIKTNRLNGELNVLKNEDKALEKQ